jgi:hypothetical protein
VLSDPHVAAHHLVLRDVPEVGLALAVGDTANGVGLGSRHAGRGTTVALADGEPLRGLELRVGRTLLRLRLPGEALAPEVVLARAAVGEPRPVTTALLGLALLGAISGIVWLDTDPVLLPRALGGTLLLAVFAAAVWCGVWALLSKTFTRQGRFGWHVRVFVQGALAALAIHWVAAVGAFALSWAWLADFAFVAVFATVAFTVWSHLVAVEPARGRMLAAVAASGFVGAVALALWLHVQGTGRMGADLYLHRLFPPALRLAAPVPVDDFVGRLADDRAVVDRQAKDKGGANDADEGDERE